MGVLELFALRLLMQFHSSDAVAIFLARSYLAIYAVRIPPDSSSQCLTHRCMQARVCSLYSSPSRGTPI